MNIFRQIRATWRLLRYKSPACHFCNKSFLCIIKVQDKVCCADCYFRKFYTSLKKCSKCSCADIPLYYEKEGDHLTPYCRECKGKNGL